MLMCVYTLFTVLQWWWSRWLFKW